MVRFQVLLVLLAAPLVIALGSRGESDFGGDDIVDTRIINGNDATANELPFLVRITEYVDAQKSQEKQLCGGTILEFDMILTAASCLMKDGKIRPLDSIKMYVGDHDTDALDNGEKKDLEAKRFIIHKDYHEDALGRRFDDIAIIVLKTPLTKADQKIEKVVNVRNAATAPSEVTVNTDDVVSLYGWGVKEDTGDIENLATATTLKKIELKLKNMASVCSVHWKTDAEDSNDVGAVDYDAATAKTNMEKAQLCAIDEDGAKRAYRGDYGGPVIRTEKSLDYLVGILSWGDKDPKVATYQMMMDVQKYEEWIKKAKETAADIKWVKMYTGGAHDLVIYAENGREDKAICKDGVGANEINVICKDLGFNVGALGDISDILPRKEDEIQKEYKNFPEIGYTELKCGQYDKGFSLDCTTKGYSEQDVVQPCVNGDQLVVKCAEKKYELLVTKMTTTLKHGRSGNYRRGKVECEVLAEKYGVSFDMERDVQTFLVERTDTDKLKEIKEMKYKKKDNSYQVTIKASDAVANPCLSCIAMIPGDQLRFYAKADLDGRCPTVSLDTYKNWVHDKNGGVQT